MTVYNRQNFLAHAIQSVLGSSFTDFELIIVDDCSTDNSRDIAMGFTIKDSRVRLYNNDYNLGDYGNRRRAASLASGQFLKYVDSDDLIYPYSLQIMVDAISSCSEAGLALCHSLGELEKPYPFPLDSRETWRIQFLGRGCLSCGPTGAIINRNAFEEIGGFRKEWGVLSDIDLWLRLSARRPIVLMPPGLVWWRRHEGQEYSTKNAEFNYLVKGYQLTIESLNREDCPLISDERRKALQRATQHHSRKLLSLLLRSQKPTLFWNALKASKISLWQLLGGFRKYI